MENIIFLLRYKSYMLLAEPESYNSLVNFIVGYELGYCNSSDKPIPSFNEWIMEKEGTKFSSNWSFYFLQKNAGDEGEAKKMLLDFFEKYLNGRSRKDKLSG